MGQVSGYRKRGERLVRMGIGVCVLAVGSWKARLRGK